MIGKILSKVPHDWIQTTKDISDLLKHSGMETIVKKRLEKGFLGFGKIDEMMFEESLVEASSQDPEIRTVIIDWLSRCLENPETCHIPFAFRDMITEKPEIEARAKVLIYYARLTSDEERNKEFKIANIKPKWVLQLLQLLNSLLREESPIELTLLCDQKKVERHNREQQTGRSTIFGRLADRMHERRV